MVVSQMTTKMLKILSQNKNSLISGFLLITMLGSIALAQELGFFPRYPYRINEIAKEFISASQDLVYLNQELKNLTEKCDCENTESQCKGGLIICDTISPQVFGQACPERKEIEETQIEIQNKIDQISYLRELLIKEMENGLEAELKTLREDEANQLKNSLTEILASSESIIPLALNNVATLNDPQYSVEKQCQAECEKGTSFKLMACIFNNLGEQSPIKLKFEVGVALDNLELGKIGIEEIDLNLPEKIELGAINNIGNYKIPLPDIIINFPQTSVENFKNLSLDSIIFHPPNPSLPTLPLGNFSCLKLDSKTYQCQGEEEQSASAYINLEWYLQTFSWLSEKCQEIPGLKDGYGAPDSRCFDKEKVHLIIIQQCDALWQDYLNCKNIPFAECNPPPGVCSSLGSPKTRQGSQQKQCQDLFQQRDEIVPPNCDLNALKNRCAQIKEDGQKEIPEPCEFLPLFTKVFEEPESQQYQGQITSCSSQIISDAPGIGISLECPILIPSAVIPKIKLPDIIIPDIRLPSFSFPPFLKVKLPSFIFEDLIFPDLTTCDLDDCEGIIPSLEIDLPLAALLIPAIKIPPIEIPIPGPAGLSTPQFPLTIEMDTIEFPPIPIPLPQLDLTNLISLNLKVPEIQLPKPKILLNFEGLDIEAINLLLGLVSTIIPIPNSCIGAGISGIPLVIGFPDYYFYWPRFPQFPDLCDNKSNFCQSVKEALNADVLTRVNKIQNIINQTVQKELQARLDQISIIYQDLIKEYISQRLEKIKEEVEKAIAEKMRMATVENGIVKIPSVKVSLGDYLGEINIPMEKVNERLSKIPKEIKIPWPEDLKKVKLTKPIAFQLPSIPLNDLGYKKNIDLKAPGFQYPSLKFSADILGNYPSCEGQTPSGGNPYPVDKINVNLGEIIGLDKKINEASSKINEVLE